MTESIDQNARQPNAELGRLRWDQIKHDDMLFTNRASFFLVAQSMLLATFTILASPEHRHRDMPVAIGVAAGAVIVIWIWTTLRHLWARDHFYKEAKTSGPPYDKLQTEKQPSPGAHCLMGIVLPVLLSLIWIWLCVALFLP